MANLRENVFDICFNDGLLFDRALASLKFFRNENLFDYLNDDPALVFEQEPLSALSRDGELGCFPHDGFWQPMDTYQEFMLLNRMWEENRAQWKNW